MRLLISAMGRFKMIDKLNAFLKSPAGQKKVAVARKAAHKAGQAFGQGGGASTKEAEQAAQKLKDALSVKLKEAHLEKIAESGIIVGEPAEDKVGNLVIDINFDPEMLHRDSLYPKGHPKGISDIIVHLTHGWDAQGEVFGYWKRAGDVIRSAKHMDKNEFLKRAVSEFNALGIGEATLHDKYL